MNEPSKMFYVLGVSHTMQGETTVPRHFEDRDHATLVTDIISSTGVDFVGEEGGNEATFAEKITNDLLDQDTTLTLSRKTDINKALATPMTVMSSQGQAVSSTWCVGSYLKMKNARKFGLTISWLEPTQRGC